MNYSETVSPQFHTASLHTMWCTSIYRTESKDAENCREQTACRCVRTGKVLQIQPYDETKDTISQSYMSVSLVRV